ncbi:hypothetical protein XM48_00200 [Leucobacter sp. Ag1]|nr:hypothetical protein XM48_00200 [Leucobacter sp. Ag1]
MFGCSLQFLPPSPEVHTEPVVWTPPIASWEPLAQEARLSHESPAAEASPAALTSVAVVPSAAKVSDFDTYTFDTADAPDPVTLEDSSVFPSPESSTAAMSAPPMFARNAQFVPVSCETYTPAVPVRGAGSPITMRSPSSDTAIPA